MNNWTWFGILELAEEYGWNPLGTVIPDDLDWIGVDPAYLDPGIGIYWGKEARLVLLEDALNLADALEEAFLKYEPVRLPSLHSFYLAGEFGETNGHPPAVGVIQILIHFCQRGAFTIEPA
jgi:hypothetical protein